MLGGWDLFIFLPPGSPSHTQGILTQQGHRHSGQTPGPFSDISSPATHSPSCAPNMQGPLDPRPRSSLRASVFSACFS